MKIALIGAGNVGTVLGKGLSDLGHEVIYGLRNPEDTKYDGLKDFASLKSVAEATQEAELIFLATPWSQTKNAIDAMQGNYKGKILIDCTNPLKDDLSGLTHGFDTSGGEEVAKWASGARVVKAFNTTGTSNMAAPEFDSRKSLMLIASDDDEARLFVKNLADELGFDSYEFGDLSSARYMEPFAYVWISLAFKQGLGADFAFTINKKELAHQ